MLTRYEDMPYHEQKEVRVYGCTIKQLQETIDSYNDSGQTHKEILLRLIHGAAILVEDTDHLAYQQLNRAWWLARKII